jgi:protease IV
MNFLKTFFAAFLAVLIFSILAVVVFVGLIGSLASEKQVVIKENSVLHLELDAEIHELQQENPFEGMPLPGGDVKSIGLMQLKQAIENAKNNDNIKGSRLPDGRILHHRRDPTGPDRFQEKRQVGGCL